MFPNGALPGITPAYAGKSGLRYYALAPTKDHPRLRGEKFYRAWGRFMEAGSPPLTRGKECRQEKRTLAARITPAYAGKRRSIAICSFSFRDHPRLRGEK